MKAKYDVILTGHSPGVYTLVRCADDTQSLIAIANLEDTEAVQAALELVNDGNRGAATSKDEYPYPREAMICPFDHEPCVSAHNIATNPPKVT